MHDLRHALLVSAILLQEGETHLVPLDSHMTSASMPFSCMSLFITASAITERHTLLSLTNKICACVRLLRSSILSWSHGVALKAVSTKMLLASICSVVDSPGTPYNRSYSSINGTRFSTVSTRKLLAPLKMTGKAQQC